MNTRTLIFATALCACVKTTAPQPAPVRNPTPVAAGFVKTWDAVIDVFADLNIPIATMDRASGFIATSPLSISFNDDALRLADCGSVNGVPYVANQGIYNIVVRGDSVASTVKVTASFSGREGQCSTRAVFEQLREQEIKDRAEGRYVAPQPVADTGIRVGDRVRVNPPEGGIVSAYSAPDSASKVTMKFKNKLVVRVIDVRGEWVRIAHSTLTGEDTGWILATNLRPN